MVANFRPVKGQEFFVQAAASVLKELPDVQFVIAGSQKGEYYEKVAALMKNLGVESRFFCLGDRSDVAELLPCFDIFVLSSLHEGFSNAIVEAMAAGIPVIATAAGGNPEAIEDGRSGFLVEPRNPSQLADRMMRLLNDQNLRTSMSERGRQIILEKFNYDHMIEAITHLVAAKAKKPARISS